MSPFIHPRRYEFRFLCWFLAALMFVTPSLPALAQQPAAPPAAENLKPKAETDKTLLADPAVAPAVEPLDLTYLLPQACLAVAARPRQLFATPTAAMMPLEVVQAASLQQTGLDALELETVLFSVEPPMAGPPNYALMATFANSVEGKLHPQLTAHTQPGQIDGRQYFQSQHPLMPSIYSIDGKTLLASPDMALQKLVASETAPAGNLLAERLQAASADDFYAAVNIEVLRPLINQLMVQQPIPPEMLAFAPAPDLIRLVELRINLSGTGPTELVVEANNAADANKLVAMLQQVIDRGRAQTMLEVEKLKQSADPVEQALGKYQERMMNQMSGMFLPTQEGARLVIFRQLPSDNPQAPMVTVAIVGILVALLLPAIQSARQAARRASSMNNMKQVMLGLLNHEDVRKSFPAHASYDSNGKPLLSWRVHLLPFIEEQVLYSKFHLDEPWDSEHNRQLISQMPAVYLDPSSRFSPTDGKTHYLGVCGEGCLFDGSAKGTNISSVTDGSSNTIAVLQVNDERATTWTKPDDWEYDQNNPLAGLTPSLHEGGILAARSDGSVFTIGNDFDPSQLKAMLTISAGD